MARLHGSLPALCAAALVVIGAGAACAGHTGLPLVPRSGLVPIASWPTLTRAAVLSPPPEGSGSRPVIVRAETSGRDAPILIRDRRDGPPPRAVTPAFVVDGRLWCPRRGPTGRFTEPAAAVLALDAQTITSVEVVRDSAAAAYARRCVAPVDAVVRIRTRAPGDR